MKQDVDSTFIVPKEQPVIVINVKHRFPVKEDHKPKLTVSGLKEFSEICLKEPKQSKGKLKPTIISVALPCPRNYSYFCGSKHLMLTYSCVSQLLPFPFVLFQNLCNKSQETFLRNKITMAGLSAVYRQLFQYTYHCIN